MESGSYMPQLGIFTIANATLPFYTDSRPRRSLWLHRRLPEYNSTYLKEKIKEKPSIFPLISILMHLALGNIPEQYDDA